MEMKLKFPFLTSRKKMLNSSENKYEILCKVGEGSFGVVHKAKLKNGEDFVAIKVFNSSSISTQNFISAFGEQECLQLFTDNAHPFIITLKEHFMVRSLARTKICLVMEFLPETMYHELQKFQETETCMPNILVKSYMNQLFRALAHIHSFKLCHRDIKPENILLNPHTNTLKLCDFSCAKLVTEEDIYTPIEYQIGSTYYQAPELFLQCACVNGFALDMWAAGCILAECAMGCNLFAGETVEQVMEEIIEMLGAPHSLNVRFVSPSQWEWNIMKGVGVRMKMQKRMATLQLRMSSEWEDEVVNQLGLILVYRGELRIRPMEACCHPFFLDLQSEQNILPKDCVLPLDLFCFTHNEVHTESDIDGLYANMVRSHLTPTHLCDVLIERLDRSGWSESDKTSKTAPPPSTSEESCTSSAALECHTDKSSRGAGKKYLTKRIRDKMCFWKSAQIVP